MKSPNVPAEYVAFSDWYQNGFARGYNAASWQDIPDIGSKLPRHIDYQGLGEISDVNGQRDALQMLASEAESNGRDFSPFEFTAKELNDHEDSESLWEAFDAGISAGIDANIAERLP